MDLSAVKEIAGFVVKALCNTLVHSLWQGLLLAAVAGLIIICTRRSTPARRYNLLIASLVLFTCTVTYTFIIQMQEVQVYRTMVFIKPHQLLDNTPDVHIKISTPAFTQISGVNGYQVISFLNDHSYTIVLIWFLIVFARSLQLMTGLHSLYYLRRRNIFAVDEGWQNRVKELAQQLGIKQLVHIAESGMAKVPMVIGHLKPLILIPVGLMTALSADEIEAILVHELAHIRRRDYLVNLLVSFMEIIFFFNPAVLWLSSLIKAERENCCDDIAVTQTSSKLNYIRALVSCQEYQLSAPAYAMAFSGRKNHLMGRVKRMVSNSNQSLNVMEKSLLAVCLVTAGLLTTAFSNADKINELVDNTAKAITHVSKAIKQQVTSETVTEIPDSATIKPVMPIVSTIKAITDTAQKTKSAESDTIKNDKVKLYQPSQVTEHTELVFPNGNLTTHLLKENGVLYQINLNGKTLSLLQVNGKTITANQYAAYMPVVTAVLKRNTAETAQPIDEITPIKEPIQPIEPIHPINVNTSVDLSNLNTDVKIDLANKSLGKLDAANQKQLSSSKTKLSANQTKLGEQQAYLASQAKYDADKLNSYKPYNSADYKPYDAKKEESNKDKLASELVQQGIIDKRDDLTSFKLSDTEFIVNGKKMPDDVYTRFKKEFVPAPENGKKGTWSWMYNYTSTTETTIK